MSDFYTCKVCSTKYEYQGDMKRCEKSHNTKVTDHSDSKDLKKLEGMTEALRNNDYDKNNTSTDNGKQRTLRNHKVRQNKLKQFN